MLIEGSKWTLLENPFDSTKSKKRKSEKKIIVYRWVFQRQSAWCWEGFKSSPLIFQATHQTHKNSTKQNRHFPMSISGSYKKPKSTSKLQWAAWTGRTSSLCHLHSQQETSLVPSTRDLTCTLKKRSHLHPQKGVLWGPLKGPEIDMEKCRFSLCEVATFSCAWWLPWKMVTQLFRNGHLSITPIIVEER